MGRLSVGVVMVITVLCNVVMAKNCVKVDQCKCTFDDGSGTIDLSPLGKQDGIPLMEDQFAPDNYAYSYNPCYPFTEGTCVNAAACQFDSANAIYYNVGDASNVDFSYNGKNVLVNYISDDQVRSSTVELECDPSADNPSVIANGEDGVTHYSFTMRTKHACAKQPEPGNKSCAKIDECKCQFTDGSGIVDLSTIGKQDGTPLFKDVPGRGDNDTDLYSYNPCYPFSTPESTSCQNVSLCQYQPKHDLHYSLGSVKDDKFFYDGLNLYIRYTSEGPSVTRTSIVRYVCDPSASQPTMVALGEVNTAEYIFTVTTSAACPKPAPVCKKIDNCRCTMDDGSGEVDLSSLGKQSGPPLVNSVLGHNTKYLYSFNPCYPTTVGTCKDVAFGARSDAGCPVSDQACLLDPDLRQYFDIGDPTVEFTSGAGAVVGTYSAGDKVRKSRVTYVCGTEDKFEAEGEISPANYGFKITSPKACPVKPMNMVG